MIIPLKTRFLNLTDEEFFQFCQEMQDVHVEREADGTIMLMEPTGSETGSFDLEVGAEVRNWNRETRRGKSFGSQAGFTLPNNAVKSPDVAWIELERWLTVPPQDRKRFAHISPDFVIEIRSETDALDRLKQKMVEYIENGVRLGWLIDPQSQQVWIYRADGSVDQVEGFDTPLSGEKVLEGFELRLGELWEGERE
jgi:Uma2 family endonuclease